MTIRFVAAAAALAFGVATVAAPALAEPRTVPTPATTESVDAPTPKPSKLTRYCVDTQTTGSLLTKRVCHTRQEWLDTGVDPLDYLPR